MAGESTFVYTATRGVESLGTEVLETLISNTVETLGSSPGTGTWTIGVSATDTLWRGATYGNGLFVAVSLTGTGNRVMTSTDGITWTTRTSAADNQWHSVAYGNGVFAAVANTGTGNRAMTSPDGITWTIRTSAADNVWNGVTYGEGLFVAVSNSGTGNRVMTSPDGITWTIRTSAADNAWWSVAYGGGLFVAVSSSGTGNRVMTSVDGITWVSRTSAADNNWLGVTYGDGLFVAVANTGTGDRVMTSPDGTTWTIRTSAADNEWYSVTHGNGLFVAVASSGTGNRVMTSPDGITWTIGTSAADNNWRYVVYGNGLLVAISYSGTGNRAMAATSNYFTSDSSSSLIGLDVHGSIAKVVVANGAETVAYSGFSAANYLEQLYSDKLDFGVTDFSASFWLKIPDRALTENIIDRDSIVSAQRIRVYMTNVGQIVVAIHDGTIAISAQSVTVIDDDTWQHVAFNYDKSAGEIKIYINKVLDVTGSGTVLSTLSNVEAVLRVGLGVDNASPLTSGSLALLKIEPNLYTQTQINTIYNSEKHLFQRYASYTVIGENYTVSTKATVKSPQNATIKKRQIALDQITVQSTIMGRTTFFDITSALIDYDELGDWREFEYSTSEDEIFTFTPGAGYEPNESFDASIESYAETRVGDTNKFRVSLKLRKRE